MELYKNVYQIQSLYGGRNLFQYLLVGANVVLVDTGIAETPEKVIFPYMDRLKLQPNRLTFAVTTHADLDHQGGNDAIKQSSPGTFLACGEGDRALVEDPRALFDARYNFMRAEHGVGFENDPPPDAGRKRAMDFSFSGGERIRLGDGWALEVLHVPGHSHGHLALYDPTHRAAFVGDAIHGRGCPKAAGGMGIPVTYYFVDIYLSTLRYFEGYYSGSTADTVQSLRDQLANLSARLAEFDLTPEPAEPAVWAERERERSGVRSAMPVDTLMPPGGADAVQTRAEGV